MKKPNHERIYLIPGSYDGEHCYVWSDDPAPGAEDSPTDAVEYVRADLVPAGNDVLAKRIAELSRERDTALCSSLTKHLERQIAFSLKAFGPAKRTGGIIDHIRKELVEVANAPEDITEWIDLAMLALDGAWRHVDRSNMSFAQVAELVHKTLTEKLAKNESRNWPDWRQISEDKAIEHDRSNEPEDDDPAAIAVMAGHYEDLAQSLQQVEAERDTLITQVEQLSKNQLPDGYITAPEEAWHDLAQQEKKVFELQAQIEKLRNAVFCSVAFISNDKAKSGLISVYDKTPAQCLAERDAEVAAKAFMTGYKHGSNWHSVYTREEARDLYLKQLRQQAKDGAA